MYMTRKKPQTKKNRAQTSGDKYGGQLNTWFLLFPNLVSPEISQICEPSFFVFVQTNMILSLQIDILLIHLVKIVAVISSSFIIVSEKVSN